MKAMPIFLFVSVLVSSCVPPEYYQYGVETRHDDFYNYTVTSMYNNNIGCDYCNEFQFNVSKFQDSISGVFYRISVYVSLKDWMFIESGESLILLVDGERIGLSGKGSSGRRDVEHVINVYVTERASYDVTLEQLQKIANAKQVRIRLSGSRMDEDGILTQDNISRIKGFLTQYASK